MVEYFFGRPDFIFGSKSNSSPGQLNQPRPALLDLELSSPGGDHHPEAATVVKVWHSTATHIRWSRFKWCSVCLKLSNTTSKFATCTLGNDRNRVLTKRSFCKHKRDTAFIKTDATPYQSARGSTLQRGTRYVELARDHAVCCVTLKDKVSSQSWNSSSWRDIFRSTAKYKEVEEWWLE